jgi:hypothetical protein
VTLIGYLSNVKKSTNVISAKPINNVLWPHRATVPIIFQSPRITLIVYRRSTVAAHVLYGDGTVHFQAEPMHVAGLKNRLLRFSAIKALRGSFPAHGGVLTFDRGRVMPGEI